MAGPSRQETAERTGGSGRPSSGRRVLEWVVLLGGALVVALIVRQFLVQTFFIPSESMVPALEVGDRVLVNKLSYDLHAVHRGDLVVFERPSGPAGRGERDLVKRVVALEGETVSDREGRVLVDGEPLDESYLGPGTKTVGIGLRQVPEGHVFVMGDNRGNSRDSRVFGAVDEDDIVGRAFVRVWPIDDFGFL